MRELLPIAPTAPAVAFRTVEQASWWLSVRSSRSWESIRAKSDVLQRWAERYWSRRNGQVGTIQISGETQIGQEHGIVVQIVVPVLIGAPPLLREAIVAGFRFAFPIIESPADA